MRMFACEQSTQIAGYGYDPKTFVLQVNFRAGGTYRYLGVSHETFEKFIEAESKGQFLNREIKPTHRYER